MSTSDDESQEIYDRVNGRRRGDANNMDNSPTDDSFEGFPTTGDKRQWDSVGFKKRQIDMMTAVVMWALVVIMLVLAGWGVVSLVA